MNLDWTAPVLISYSSYWQCGWNLNSFLPCKESKKGDKPSHASSRFHDSHNSSMLMLSTVKTVVRFFNSHVWPAIAGAFVLFFSCPWINLDNDNYESLWVQKELCSTSWCTKVEQSNSMFSSSGVSSFQKNKQHCERHMNVEESGCKMRKIHFTHLSLM